MPSLFSCYSQLPSSWQPLFPFFPTPSKSWPHTSFVSSIPSAPKSKSPKQDYCEGLLHHLLGKWAMSQNFKGGKSQSLQPGKRAPSLSPQQCLLGSLPWPLFSKARFVNPQPHLALSFRKTPLLSHPSARRVKETHSGHVHGSQP